MSKACQKTGCPKCAMANAGKKADGTRQKQPYFCKGKARLARAMGP